MDDRERKSVVENIIANTARNRLNFLEAALEDAHPAEIADAMRHLEPKVQESIMDLLSPENAATVGISMPVRDSVREGVMRIVEKGRSARCSGRGYSLPIILATSATGSSSQ